MKLLKPFLLCPVLIAALSACTGTRQLQVDPEVRPFFEQVLAYAENPQLDLPDDLADSYFSDRPDIMLPGYAWVLTQLYDHLFTEHPYYYLYFLSSALNFDSLEEFRAKSRVLQDIACGPYPIKTKLSAAYKKPEHV